MKSAQELIQTLTQGGKIRFTHDQRGKILPYFTRNPERAKFLNGFHPVVGSIVRRSLKLSMPAEFDDGIVDREKLNTNVNLNSVPFERFMQVFSDAAIERVHLPRLLAYSPLSDGNEAKGDITVADFIYQLYRLEDNNAWFIFLKNESATNPYERLILANAKRLDELKSKENQFQFIKVDELQSKFTSDLVNILDSRQFFDEHIDTLLAFYYFTYSVKLIASVERTDHNSSEFKPYYALESERLSQSRRAAGSHSFRTLRISAKNLLVETDVLDYINILLDRDYMFLPDIMALTGSERTNLEYELRVFITQFNYGMQEYKIDHLEVETADLSELIRLLRLLLTKNMKLETLSRYMKSFDEIAKLDFVKTRGRLGKTFNVSDELLITLVGVVLGKQKMMLNDFFHELEVRGIYLDRSSRDHLVELLNDRNLLEKMSDSGDAQYVKPLF